MKKQTYYYAFYLDSFDWGITTDSSYEGEMHHWEQFRTYGEAKRSLIAFFDDRVKDYQRMKKSAGKIKMEMVHHGDEESK